MLPKDIQSYGGPYLDAEAVENPQTEQSADLGNRVFEDTAQLTRTAFKAFLRFATTLVNGAVTVHADSHTQWGSSSFYFPTLTRIGAGTYTAQYASSYADALAGGPSDAVAETETVAFKGALGQVRGTTVGKIQHDIASNVVTIYVFSSLNALSDLGGGVTVEVWIR